ncbi:MAG: hypothetical protein HQ567_07255 [Candidatus Nealsonbacteria bacterium]|nr:hypothetical protein [Candidatus Nealsonbacteria bacterium]
MARSGARRLRVEPLEQRQLFSVTAATYDPAMPDVPGLVDDGSAGFEQIGTGWNAVPEVLAWQGDFQYHTPGDGSNVARWTLEDLTPGAEYRVYASWSAHPFGDSSTALHNPAGADRDLLASNARYTLDDDAAMHREVHVDQRATHDWATDAVIGPLPQPTVQGPYWQPLGTFRVETDTLTVELSDAADGIVMADAVGVIEVVDLIEPIDDGMPGYSEGGKLWRPANWRSATAEEAYQGDFRFSEPGSQATSATWAFEDLVPGTRYEVLATWIADTDRATDAQYTIRDGLRIEGIAEVDQQYTPAELSAFGQSWESLGAVTVDSGTLRVELSGNADGIVVADAVVIVELATTTTAPPVLDDGDAAFAQQHGKWQRLANGDAYGGDLRYHEPGNGNNATTWTFDALEPGLSYRVYATWPDAADPAVAGRLAADAPFEVFDDEKSVGQLRVNQQVPPDDLEGEGRGWQFLGVYRIDSGTMTVRLSDDASGVVLADAVVTAAVREQTAAPKAAPSRGGEILLAGQGFAGGVVVDRHVFYNRSEFDDNNPAANVDDDDAVAPHEWTESESGPGNPPGENLGKVALLPGQTAAFNNYTSYSRGINGVMIDVEGLDGTPVIDDDLEFYVGNDSDPDNWSSADDPASITLRTGAGTNGSDRVTIIWTDNDIRGEWLQVRMLATDTTNLASDEVFYFGNAPAEAGNSTTDAKVTTIDLLLARNNPRNFLYPAAIDFGVDFDRDTNVNATDVLLARNNQTNFLNALNLISVPAADIEIIQFYTDSNELKVKYIISGGYTEGDPAPDFDVNIYSSADGVVPETQLIATETVSLASMLDDGEHILDISPDFTDPKEDYYLMAVVQADVDVAGNNLLFEGGIFLDDNDIVQIHGRDIVDPELDKQDLVDLDVVKNDPGPNGPYTVTLGDETPRTFTSAEVTEFHIRTHDGNDVVTTPKDYIGGIEQSEIQKAMWVFAGAGHDIVYGGDLADWLYGGPGDDDVSGRPGGDFIYGQQGNDALEGHNGNDRIEGGAGDDIIEGWGDSDEIYGGPGDDTILSGMLQGDPPATLDTGDHVYGGDGNDRIDGYIGIDYLFGDSWNDYDHIIPMIAPGNDEIYGHDGYDLIFGGDGHDDLFGESVNDFINDGDGNDNVNGEPVDGNPLVAYPQVDLVADVDGLGEFDAFYGSDDNRAENGFYGGKFVHTSQARQKVEIHVHENSMDLTGYGLRLENSNPDALQVWTSETGGSQISTPAVWTIDVDVPAEIYVEGLQADVAEFRLTVLDPISGEPVGDRPLADYMRIVVAVP